MPETSRGPPDKFACPFARWGVSSNRASDCLGAHFVNVADVSSCLDFLRKGGVWNPNKVWGGVHLIPQHVLDTLTSLLCRHKKPSLWVFRLLFCNPIMNLLHVSEEGKLGRCHNAHKARYRYPKRPSDIKRITLIYIE